MRRTLIIGAAIIALGGAGTWAYIYFIAGSPNLEITDTGLPTSDAFPASDGTAMPNGDLDESSVTRVSSRLTRISAGPVVPGVIALNTMAAGEGDASSTPSIADVEVRYVERESGNIYSYLVRAGRSTRISNKTLPGIAEASWLLSGETVFVRYLSGADLSTIDTYGLAADGSGGFFLPQDLSGLAVSSTSVLTLASGTSGSVASVLQPDGTGSAVAFTSPLASLRAAFAGKNRYLAFTKPSVALPGYVFLVNGSGRFSRLAGPLPGLVATPNHAGTQVLISSAGETLFRMALVSTDTGEEIALPIGTVADKCVWTDDDDAIYCAVPVSPPASYSYPDDWYQGAVHFSDRVWKIDVSGRFAQLVLEPPTDSTGPVDAVGLALDPSGTVLVFVNKNDGSLWSYQL